MGDIIIRKAKISEIGKKLAFLHFIAYENRFFNEKTAINSAFKICKEEKIKPVNVKNIIEFGGCLGVDYPKLIPNGNEGQSLISFTEYWNGKREEFKDGSFIAFVAEDKATGELVGFVKGDHNINDYGSNELGSIYINPNYKNSGIGFKLVKRYFTEILEKNPNCNSIMTDCYIRNNSQYFFNRLGATFHSFCAIPNLYIEKNKYGFLEMNTKNIGGEMLIFSRESVENVLLADNSKCLPKPEKKYTRNREYYKQIIDNIQKIALLPVPLKNAYIEKAAEYYNVKIEEEKLLGASEEMGNLVLEKQVNNLPYKKIV